MRRIFFAISNLLTRVRYTIIFDHLKRSHNIAGLLLEQWKIKEGKVKGRADFNVVPLLLPAAL
jgi:hypothetical protein